jgi:hypothetical protein
LSLSQKYQKSKDLKWSLQFTTYYPGGYNFDGVVTHIQKNFIVLRVQRDFVFGGIVVLPKKVIKGYRDGKVDQCFNEILRHSGNIKDAKSPHWLDHCTTLQQILERVQKKDIWPIIEILYKLDRKTETDFFIGKITRIEKDAFWIYDYDAEGKWQKEFQIRYDEIFRIGFNDRYSRYFNAFMRTRPPRENRK